MKKCSFPGCTKPHCAKGLCNSHWAQQARGYELTPIVTHETAEERFLRLTVKREDGCWEFIGSGKGSGKSAKDGQGYGQLWHNGKRTMAHRWAYEHYVGPLDPNDQVDHLCRNKKCCNPEHLEPVSQYENMRRLRFAQYLNKRIETLENFIISLGHDPSKL